MARDKYHAELRFHDRKVRFTAVDLNRLIDRFNGECAKEQQRVIDDKEYTYVIPQLTTQLCGSWSQFDA